MLNWDDIIYACQSEATCLQINFTRPDWPRHSSTLGLFAVFYYCLFFSLSWLYTLLHFVLDLRPLLGRGVDERAVGPPPRVGPSAGAAAHTSTRSPASKSPTVRAAR